MNAIYRSNRVTVYVRDLTTNIEYDVFLSVDYEEHENRCVPEIWANLEEEKPEGWPEDLLDELTDFIEKTRNVDTFLNNYVVHVQAQRSDCGNWVINLVDEMKPDSFYRQYAKETIDLDCEHQLNADALVVHGDDGFWVAVMHYVPYPKGEQNG